MRRVLVIGNSGSGKTTLALRLSKRLALPFYATDHFYWDGNWKKVSSENVRHQINHVIHQDVWVLDGNFDAERDLVWQQADSIIWLDYPRGTIIYQILMRNFRWLITRQETWSGNKMNIQRAISGIHHAIKSYKQKRLNYPCWLAELSGITIHRFRSKQETEAWFQCLVQ